MIKSDDTALDKNNRVPTVSIQHISANVSNLRSRSGRYVTDDAGIVIELHQNLARCGFSGEARPRNTVFYTNGLLCSIFDNSSTDVKAIDWNIEVTRDCSSFKRKMTSCLKQIFFKYLCVDPRNRHILMNESMYMCMILKDSIKAVVLGYFKAKSLTFVMSCLSATWIANPISDFRCLNLSESSVSILKKHSPEELQSLTNKKWKSSCACVISIDYFDTTIIPVYDDRPLTNCIVQTSAVQTIHQSLVHLLFLYGKITDGEPLQRGLNDTMTKRLLSYDLSLLFQITSQLGLHAKPFERKNDEYLFQESLSITVGSVVVICPAFLRWLPVEFMIQPDNALAFLHTLADSTIVQGDISHFQRLETMLHTGLVQGILESISKCARDVIAVLSESLLMTNVSFRGLEKRICMELSKHLKCRVDFLSTGFSSVENIAWAGMSLYGTLHTGLSGQRIEQIEQMVSDWSLGSLADTEQISSSVA